MINASIIKNYPRISAIFNKDWFEKELKKDKEEMHPLAKQFTDKDLNENLDSHSLQYIDYIEKLLTEMECEINSQKDHFKRLRTNKNEYISTLAEIEIGSFFKNMGFKIEFESPISGKKGKKGKEVITSDIKINSDGVDVFIEVSIKERPRFEFIVMNENNKFKVSENTSNYRNIKPTQPSNYGVKLEGKIRQLSGSNPNIVALYLDPSSTIEINNIPIGLGLDRVWITNGHIFPVKKGWYLFRWEEVPGDDSETLLKFLKQKFDISWVENAKIEKIDNDSNIRITAEKNYLSLELNNEKTKVNLKIDDGRSAEFIAKSENGKLYISIDFSMISAVLVYIRSKGYFDNTYKILTKLWLNPKANNQLPNSLIKKIKDSGTDIINPEPYNELLNNPTPSEC